MGLFSGGKKENVVLVLDIGSGSVGGALISLGEAKPKILFSTRNDIVFQNDFKFERFLSLMLKSSEAVLSSLKEKSPKVSKVVCVLSAPWYVSQTRTVLYEQDKPFLITKKKLDLLIEEEVTLLKKDFDAHYKDVTKSNAEIIEVKNIHMKLNGYETSSPFGKQAKSLEAFLYVSMSSEHVLEALRKKVSVFFPGKEVTFNSFSLVTFSTLRDIYSNIHDFMYIDISGEMSDISIVRKNALIETLTFPLGQHFVLRTIASHLGTVSEEARSILSLYDEGKITEDSKEKILGVLGYVEKEWMETFKKDLRLLSTHVVLPRKIFVITDSPFTGWFGEILKKGDYKDISLMGDSLDVELLNEKVIGKFGSFQLDVPRDVFILLEALFVHKTSNFSP